MGLVMICCGGGLLPILLKLGEPVSRGLEGGIESVSEVPREPVFVPCLRGTNRAVPPRALDKVSSSSFETTFSEVNLGRGDFLDWYSLIDAIALLTSLPRIGYDRSLGTLSIVSIKSNIRGFSQPSGCVKHSGRARRMTPN